MDIVVEELYYLCSENKGADQLRCYRTADLRLGFLHMQKGFLMSRLINNAIKECPAQYNFPYIYICTDYT